MASFKKRLGFLRRNTDRGSPALHGEDELSSSPGAGVGTLDEKDPAFAEVAGLSEHEANRKLSLFGIQHQWDPNMSNDAFDIVDEAMLSHDVKAESNLVGEMVENSPYPEVRASVRNYDEDLPANTIRAWFLGMILTTLGSGLNALFSLRAPSITITTYVAQLVAYPLGVGMAWILPNHVFNLFGLRFNLNPGPFNIKEHTLIVVMANASFGTGVAYFTDTVVVQRAFYNNDLGWGFNILLALTTQVTGFGLAGLMRKFLVEPASMIWPAQLVNTAFMYGLHDHSKSDPTKTNGWGISRYRWFLYVFAGAFIWYWIPGYLFQALSVFAFATFIRPNNVVVNQLFGGWTGISLLPITFDWTQITGYIFSPLIPPWHAIGNTLIGVVFWFWILTSALHYSGHFYSKYLPISDNQTWDNTQSVYNVSKILTPEYTLDVEKYRNYSPLFLSTSFAVAYGLNFASIAAVVSHVALFHGREIYHRARAAHGEMDDIHTKMMKRYPLVPNWWYGILFISMVGMSFGAIYGWPTHLSWWALIIAFLISAAWMLPIGMIQGITNIQLGLNVFTEFIIGYMQPGRPLAMMLFKTYGYITMTQALAFTQDLKLGHYMKVPQRSMFWGQTSATIWSCFVQLAVVEWGMGHISDICTDDQANKFTCPGPRTFFNASVIWGLVGPKRLFSAGATYVTLQYFWLAGFFFPFIIYFGARMFPRSNIRFLSAPIIFGGTGYIPPATPLNYLSWGIVGFIFQKYIRNKYRGWWMRFNYITSAALDVGLAIATIVIIAALNLTNTDAPSWWGNNVILNPLDWQDAAIQTMLKPGETFGPPKGSWS
ncbi:MAG: hypothetical protein Q9227_006230 [Pyrenula ochraceoflavens]